MLHLIPAPLHRMLYRVADRARRRWWRVRKPRRSSVVILAHDARGRVLLVRHSYGRPLWALPAGGIGRGETPEHAAAREFGEELGCPLAELRPLGSHVVDETGSRDRQHVFVARLAGKPVPDNREIVAAQCFDPAALPADTGRLTRERVARWHASKQG